MADVDPDTLLEWLQMGVGQERDMQLIALEQLCMLLLMSDNVDRCFEMCPPRSFLPALCKIFLDETAPDNVVEVAARAMTYYLDVSADCTRRIVAVDGAVKAICNRLSLRLSDDRTNKDLSEQCVKVLEFICTREPGAVFEAGGLSAVMKFVCNCGSIIHKDTLHSSMFVVSRLCGKVEATSDSLPECIQSLSSLLHYDDAHVADSALKCFSSLADRFARKGVNPEPLDAFGLTDELIKRLGNCGNRVPGTPFSKTKQTGGTPNATPDSKANFGITTVVNLLCTLCRGSSEITHKVLRSDLSQAIEDALKGNERCCLDTMRICDLLLILLFEGRQAIPKHYLGLFGAPRCLNLSNRRMETMDGERSHRQLIDCIRSKDTEALIDAVESGVYDVNFMDDVGQTLLNWAAAFGTQEMVDFLCDRGADVNKGQRSSSLHYAACFGRPAVVKTLLLNSANPTLHDEEGKTALEKAKERNDDGHKEVVKLLEDPGILQCVKFQEQTKDAEKKSKEEEKQNLIKGDSPVASVFINKLLPLFLDTYQVTVYPSVAQSALSLLHKTVKYVVEQQLRDAVLSAQNIPEKFANVVSTALDQEDNDEGHLAALEIIQNLMDKCYDLFACSLNHEWIANKIRDMFAPHEDKEDDGAVGGQAEGIYLFLYINIPVAQESSNKLEECMPTSVEDATSMKPGSLYSWKKTWTFARGKGCLYLWSSATAIELSHGSNGWFRYILDGKLSTMYSSGSPEGGTDSSESRSEFLEKLQRAFMEASTGEVMLPVLSKPDSVRITAGNWTIVSNKEDELLITNSDGQQATILKKEMSGFLFESNRGTRHAFTPESLLSMDFLNKSVDKKTTQPSMNKEEELKDKIVVLSRSLYDEYFTSKKQAFKNVVTDLKKIAQKIEEFSSRDSDINRKCIFYVVTRIVQQSSLTQLRTLLEEDKGVSAFDLYNSGLIQAMLKALLTNLNACPIVCFKGTCSGRDDRIEKFKLVFSKATSDAVQVLVRKLISVLESIERFPVQLYDSPTSFNRGLHLLSRKFSFKMEYQCCADDSNLVDYTGRTLKMETLSSVDDLEQHILKMASKQWYDHDVSNHAYVMRAREGEVNFKYSSDFDENGIIYWIGTNAKNEYDWTNPASYGLVHVTSSDEGGLPYGKLEDILSRDTTPCNCHTSDNEKAWIALDFGLQIIPTKYSLRHSRGYSRSALRNWLFQASNDGKNWTTLVTHTNDKSLNQPGSTASWSIPVDEDEKRGWHQFRIQQNGKNSSRHMTYLSISGFEIYGAVKGVSHDPPGCAYKKERKGLQVQVTTGANKQMVPGTRVVRGVDWKWRNQDSRSVGTVSSPIQNETSSANRSRYNLNHKSFTHTNNEKSQRSVLSMMRAFHSRKDSKRSQKSGKNLPDVGRSDPAVVRSESASSSSSYGDDFLYLDEDTEEEKKQERSCAPELDGRTCRLGVYKSSPAPSLVQRRIRKLLNEVGVILKTSRTGVDTNRPSAAFTTTPTGNSHLLPPGEPVSASVSVPNLSSSEAASRMMESFVRSITRAPAILNVNDLSNIDEFQYEHNSPSLGYKGRFSVSSPLTSAQSVPNLSAPVTVASNSSSPSIVSSHSVLQAITQALVTNANNESEAVSDLFRCLVEDLPTCDPTSSSHSDIFTELDDENDEDENEEDEEFDQLMMQQAEEEVTVAISSYTWDDDHVIKRNLPALIPAFDPRPGRMNLLQTVDLEIPPPGSNETKDNTKNVLPTNQPKKLQLYLKGINLNKETIQIPLEKGCTMLNGVQKLMLNHSSSTKSSNLRKLWDTTYTIVYSEVKNSSKFNSCIKVQQWTPDFLVSHLTSGKLTKHEVLEYLKQNATKAFISRWNLSKDSTAAQIMQAFNEFYWDPTNQLKPSNHKTTICAKDVHDVLELLKTLYAMYGDDDIILTEDLICKKLNTKLYQQIEDVVCLSCHALPEWCNFVMKNYSFLFNFDVRNKFFSSTAFGPSRSIVWMQNSSSSQLDRSMAAASMRRDDPSGFHDLMQLGRLRHERVKVPREEETLLDWAINVLDLHAEKKSMLEVEFIGEEGTGLGPTLEFYSLVAAELQRKELGMWLVDDNFIQVDPPEVHGMKRFDYYVQKSGGLFPSPLPQNNIDQVVKLFHFLGILLAKCLQDARLIDLPLSKTFLKLMCSEQQSSAVEQSRFPTFLDILEFCLNDVSTSCSGHFHQIKMNLIKFGYQCILKFFISNIKNMKIITFVILLVIFLLIKLFRHTFLSKLLELCDVRDSILCDLSLTDVEKTSQLNELYLEYNGTKCKVEDLGLTFQFLPSSSVYNYTSYPLTKEGANIDLNLENARQYVNLTLNFYFKVGLEKQMAAFTEGFNRVFPISNLLLFTPDELHLNLCGDQTPQWSRDDVLAYTEPRLGFTKESSLNSRGFLHLVNVICDLTGHERKSFLQFATGCSSLPPGGLANLSPRLTIVRKVDSGDGSYPSVNTCVHYLKLPDYSTEAILKERLLAATREKGFHLN
uniref:E3 ubiquitin-protein ligase n=1 Tax=Ciona intestinalis TaxID=7719 RepID=H2XKE2_CIOIN